MYVCMYYDYNMTESYCFNNEKISKKQNTKHKNKKLTFRKSNKNNNLYIKL